MLRSSFGFLTLVFFLTNFGFTADPQTKNFVLTINGKPFPINPGETLDLSKSKIELKTISLAQNPLALYADSILSFEHPSDLSVAQTKIEAGIIQLMMANATGTLVILQEYSTMDPSNLNAMMLNELTKKSIQYGYTKSEKAVVKKLKSGAELKGLEAILSYQNEKQYWSVYSIGNKDSGVLIVTHIDESYKATDQQMIDRFWESLKIK
jgi:hypothetical protein